MTRHERLFGVPGYDGWDDVTDESATAAHDPFDINSDWHPSGQDAGMRVRCHECLSQVAVTDDVRCEVCAYKHARRVRGARLALDDA